jgi:CRP-like cAMP-binding protein
MLEEMPKPISRPKLGPLINRPRLGPANRLLAVLPPQDLLSLRAQLERVPLIDGTILGEADKSIGRVYFVESGVVSLTAAFQNGSTAEMATVGREGMVGVGSVLGTDVALGHYLVQAPGSALTMEASRFRAALHTNSPLLAVCQAYARAFLGLAVQTGACNSVHSADQRCARRLLMSHDRQDGDTFALKQDVLAKSLGVWRCTATVAAGALRSAGLIRYSRGVVTVLDRAGLEAASCECYQMIRDHFERLLPGTYQQVPACAHERPLQHAHERSHQRPLAAGSRLVQGRRSGAGLRIGLQRVSAEP